MDLGYFEISLDVKDIGRSQAFYESLGFELIDGAAEIRTVTLQKGDCRLGLYQGHLDPARTQLIFWQGDVAAITREVEAAGIGFFREPRSDEGGTAFMLLDPDGHPVFVICMRINFYNQPGYERPFEATPRTATGTGPAFGPCELSLAVADLAPSLAFYRKLGFEAAGEIGRSNAVLRNRDCTIGLYRDQPEPARLTFRHGDTQAIAGHLSAKGLDFETVGAVQLTLTDPDGHPIRFLG